MKRSTECEKTEELLPLYIDGELEAGEEAAVTAHLAGCIDCAQSLETYRALESSLSAMPVILPAPRAISSKVISRLGMERGRSLAGVFRRMSLVWTFSVTTAALILLVSRFDYVSALMSGQESFIESAGRTMDYWINTSSGFIATLTADPWVLATGMTGFGLVIFTAGIVAALKTMR